MPYQCISIDEAKSLIGTGDVNLLDIRDPDTYGAANIEHSINISTDNIEDFMASSDKTLPLIIYCYHGNSSKGAADYFSAQGYTNVYSMDGGFEHWRMKY